MKSQRQLALLAQLDRVSDYESEGRGFESLRAHHEPWNFNNSKAFFLANHVLQL